MSSEFTTVLGNCRHAHRAGKVIDHGTARTIASWYADGAHDGTYAFASTGTISDTSALWRSLTTDYDGGSYYGTVDLANRTVLAALAVYILTHGERGPVSGWSTMWAR